MDAARARTLEPTLRPEGLLGAGYYFDDLLLSPERLCLENVLSAPGRRARVNYAQAEEFRRRPDGGWTARVRTSSAATSWSSTGVLVNAAGPGSTGSGRGRASRTAGSGSPDHQGRTRAPPRLTERAIYLATADDRLVFVIPWREFSLVGTTDTDYADSPDRVWATKADVQYLLEAARRLLTDPRITEANVAYAYAGCGPHLRRVDREAGLGRLRQHRVVAEGPGGRFLSVTGTKLTCFRSLAERGGSDHRAAARRGGPSTPRGSRSTGRTRRRAPSRSGRCWT